MPVPLTGRGSHHARPRPSRAEQIVTEGQEHEVRLGVWVSNQKNRRAKLNEHQLAQLAELGLDWTGRGKPGDPACRPSLNGPEKRTRVPGCHVAGGPVLQQLSRTGGLPAGKPRSLPSLSRDPPPRAGHQPGEDPTTPGLRTNQALLMNSPVTLCASGQDTRFRGCARSPGHRHDDRPGADQPPTHSPASCPALAGRAQTSRGAPALAAARLRVRHPVSSPPAPGLDRGTSRQGKRRRGGQPAIIRPVSCERWSEWAQFVTLCVRFSFQEVSGRSRSDTARRLVRCIARRRSVSNGGPPWPLRP
jgi:hypothetical protein